MSNAATEGFWSFAHKHPLITGWVVVSVAETVLGVIRRK